MSDSHGQQQRFQDWLIASANSLRFFMIEPPRLRYERFQNSYDYQDTTSEPLVSVCVPTYNRAPILMERAVDTVLSQTYQNLELIIVGDHCTDNTAELLSTIKDPKLKFYNLPSRKKNYSQTIENHWLAGGAAPANAAMAMASGQWIARVDDDDTWTKDHVEKLLNFARANDYEFVSALYEEERHGVRKIVDGVQALDPYFTRQPQPIDDQSPKIGGVSTWFYRSYMRYMKYNVNCWRKKWNRVWDIDLALRIYGSGARIGFLDETLAFVLPRPGEESVGLEAYKLTEEEKMNHFKL
jgi:glycosyltransferase involved in cell wall biosynthesis